MPNIIAALMAMICISACSPPPAPAGKDAPVTFTLKDGGMYGRITSISKDHGNVNTDLSTAAAARLGITVKSYFRLKYGTKAYKVYLGKNYSDVLRGAWIAVDRSGKIRLARNFENAARTLGCKVGDRIFISPWQTQE